MKLPLYWKLATVRCSVLCFLTGSAAFVAGIDGYNCFADFNQFQQIKLWLSVLGAMTGTWLAFLDQTMSRLSPTAAYLAAEAAVKARDSLAGPTDKEPAKTDLQ
jgi:hypothetical protein